MNRNPQGRKALGEAIKSLRKSDSRQPSQERMAEIADVDRAYYGSIEQGAANPTFEKLWTIVSALGITWETFGRELDRHHVLRRRPITRSQMPARPRSRKRNGV